MGFKTIYTFDDPNNFNFDTDLIEIVGGVAKLRDLTRLGSTFVCTYTINEDADFSVGNGNGTLNGGAVVEDGKLKLLGGVDEKWVVYDANDNSDSQQSGAIRMNWIPNYSGNPDDFQVLSLDTNSIPGGEKNRLAIFHHTNGGIFIGVRNKDAIVIINENLGTWVPSQGQEYEFELNYNFNDIGGGNGKTELYIDGIQFGSTILNTLTRDSDINVTLIGVDEDSSFIANFEVLSYVRFSTVQHTENYAPAPLTTIYDKSNPTIIPNALISASGLLDFVESIAISGNDLIKYTIRVESQNKYWNGSSWVNSSGFEQSNIGSEIKNNISSLNLTGGFNIVPVIYLHSNLGNTTPEIGELEVEYNFNPPSTEVDTINVFGYIYKSNGQPDTDAKVIITPGTVGTVDNVKIPIKETEAQTDNDGGWSTDLIPSNDIGGIRYSFRFINGDKTEKIITRPVPSGVQIEFKDL